MDENSRDLIQKYNRANAHLVVVYDQLDKKTQELKELRESQTRQDKVTRTLCEMILRKEQDVRTEEDKKKGIKGEEPWFTYPTIKLLEKAQESYENSFKGSVEEKKHFVGLYNEKMKALNSIIQKTLSDMKGLEEELQKVSREKDELEKQLSSILKSQKDHKKDEDPAKAQNEQQRQDWKNKSQKNLLGHTEVRGAVYDEADMFEKMEGDIEKLNAKNLKEKKQGKKQSFPVTPSAERVLDEKEKAEKKKKAEQECYEARDLGIDLETMTKEEKKVFICIGETGISEIKDLVEKVGGEITQPKIRICVKELIQKNLLSGVMLTLPLSPKFNVFWLSSLGKKIYRIITQKEPVESAAQKIKKEHTTLEHGYSIVQVTEVINKSNYAKKNQAEASCIRDRKQIKVADGKAFVPDITVSSKGKVLMYIEYETTKCTEEDFIAKCDKFVQVSDTINFIVPGKNEVEVIKEHAEKWLARAKEKKIFGKPIMIRVATLRGIKDSEDKDEFSWEWEKRINSAKPER